MTSRSELPAVGDRVRLRDAYLDEALTMPVVGSVADVVRYGGRFAFVVMFEHDDPSLPPGGEFSGDRLEAA